MATFDNGIHSIGDTPVLPVPNRLGDTPPVTGGLYESIIQSIGDTPYAGSAPAPAVPKIIVSYSDGTEDYAVYGDGTNSITQADGDDAINHYDYTKIDDITVQSHIETIGSSAFSGVDNTKWNSYAGKFNIGPSVTFIGDHAFRAWEAFNEHLILSNILGSIGAYCFYGWKAFNLEFTVPATVIEIGERAFGRWDSYDQTFNFNFSASDPASVRYDNQLYFEGWGEHYPAVITTGGGTDANWKDELAYSGENCEIASINGTPWDEIRATIYAGGVTGHEFTTTGWTQQEGADSLILLNGGEDIAIDGTGLNVYTCDETPREITRIEVDSKLRDGATHLWQALTYLDSDDYTCVIHDGNTNKLLFRYCKAGTITDVELATDSSIVGSRTVLGVSGLDVSVSCDAYDISGNAIGTYTANVSGALTQTYGQKYCVSSHEGYTEIYNLAVRGVSSAPTSYLEFGTAPHPYDLGEFEVGRGTPTYSTVGDDVQITDGDWSSIRYKELIQYSSIYRFESDITRASSGDYLYNLVVDTELNSGDSDDRVIVSTSAASKKIKIEEWVDGSQTAHDLELDLPITIGRIHAIVEVEGADLKFTVHTYDTSGTFYKTYNETIYGWYNDSRHYSHFVYRGQTNVTQTLYRVEGTGMKYCM